MCALSNEYGSSAVVFLCWKAAANPMIGKNHEKDLISLLETLKDTTESLRVVDVWTVVSL